MIASKKSKELSLIDQPWKDVEAAAKPAQSGNEKGADSVVFCNCRSKMRSR
jgi:hypothetical protein